MRFMFIIKADESESAGGPPPQMMEAMHALAVREIGAGRMIDDGGLMPRAMAKEVKIRGRKLVVTDGPFAETKEVIGGYAVFELPDMAAAIKSAEDFMGLHVDHMPGWNGTMEIREVAGSMTAMVKGGG